jgi:hypothetical protein
MAGGRPTLRSGSPPRLSVCGSAGRTSAHRWRRPCPVPVGGRNRWRPARDKNAAPVPASSRVTHVPPQSTTLPVLLFEFLLPLLPCLFFLARTTWATSAPAMSSRPRGPRAKLCPSPATLAARGEEYRHFGGVVRHALQQSFNQFVKKTMSFGWW